MSAGTSKLLSGVILDTNCFTHTSDQKFDALLKALERENKHPVVPVEVYGEVCNKGLSRRDGGFNNSGLRRLVSCTRREDGTLRLLGSSEAMIAKAMLQVGAFRNLDWSDFGIPPNVAETFPYVDLPPPLPHLAPDSWGLAAYKDKTAIEAGWIAGLVVELEKIRTGSRSDYEEYWKDRSRIREELGSLAFLIGNFSTSSETLSAKSRQLSKSDAKEIELRLSFVIGVHEQLNWEITKRTIGRISEIRRSDADGLHSIAEAIVTGKGTKSRSLASYWGDTRIARFFVDLSPEYSNELEIVSNDGVFSSVAENLHWDASRFRAKDALLGHGSDREVS